MAVRIRLSRGGKKRAPFYHVVAIDARKARDSRPIEKLGTYNPASKDLNLNREAVEKWISCGASASEPVTKLLAKEGIEIPASQAAHIPAAK